MLGFSRQLFDRVASRIAGLRYRQAHVGAMSMGLESLQARCLLSVTYVDGVLTLEDFAYQGTNEDHNLFVEQLDGTGKWYAAIKLQDAFGTVISSYTSAQNDPLPSQIIANGNGGNDYIWILADQSVPTTVNGGAGRDTLTTGWGGDELLGEIGDDEFDSGPGNDTLYGGGGNDNVYGGADDDTLYGESGSDYLVGGDGNDVLEGGDDNDTLEAGVGYDQLNGGAGDDIFYYTTDDCVDTITGGSGYDTLLDRDTSDVVNADVEYDPLRA